MKQGCKECGSKFHDIKKCWIVIEEEERCKENRKENKFMSLNSETHIYENMIKDWIKTKKVGFCGVSGI